MNQLNCRGLNRCYYLYYYLKTWTHNDFLAFRLVAFKEDKPDEIAVFSRLAAAAIKKEKLKFDYVVRVLGSSELKPMTSGRVMHIAQAVAEAASAKYIPDILYKTRATKKLVGLNRHERELELKDAYAVKNTYDLDGKSVLIVDDIMTSGTSLTAVAAAIAKNYPFATLYGFCLAHTADLEHDGVAGNKPEWIKEYQEAMGK